MMEEQDGVIKYECYWDDCDCIAPQEITELNYFRTKIWQSGWIGEDVNGIGYGNISTRQEASKDGFIISGTQTGAHETLNIQQYSYVYNFNINKNVVFCKGKIKASSEALTHAAFYTIHTDIKAVTHIHNTNFWLKNLDILPTTPHNIPYGTPQMAESVRFLYYSDSECIKIILMAGHEGGILVFGDSLQDNFDTLCHFLT